MDRGGATSPLLPVMSMSGSILPTSLLNKTNKLIISVDMTDSMFDFTGSHSGAAGGNHPVLPPFITSSSVYSNAHILPHPMRKNNLLSYDVNPEAEKLEKNMGESEGATNGCGDLG
jgi:hypothetical protein